VKRNLIVIGASAVALNVLDLAHATERRIEVLIDETAPTEAQVPGSSLRVSNTLEPWVDLDHLDVAIAIGDNFLRESVYRRLRNRVNSERFVELIHPAATVSPFANVGMGSILLAGSRIGPKAIVGNFAYITANAVVTHECVLDDFVSLSPGASLGGRVRVGTRTAIGMNASVRERCEISADVVVGANSFVNFDTPSSCILGGVPAKILGERKPGERYLR